MTNIISTQAGSGCLAIAGSTERKFLIAVAIQANFDIFSILSRLTTVGPVGLPDTGFEVQWNGKPG